MSLSETISGSGLRLPATSEHAARAARAAHMESLRGYYDNLTAADWTYEYAESATAYRAGMTQIEALRRRAAESQDHAALFATMQQWGKHGGEKPARP